MRLATPILVLWVAVSTSLASPGIAWIDDLERAQRDARAGGLPILVEVFADWCLPCRIMEKEVWSRSEIAEAGRGFVALRLDSDAHERFLERYSADVLPTALLLDERGAEIGRLSGLAGVAQVTRWLGGAREGWNAYVRDRDADGDPDALERTAFYLAATGNPTAAADRLERALEVARAAGATTERLEHLELRLAQVRLAGVDWPRSEPALVRLAADAANSATRGWALAGLAELREIQGRDDEAAALDRRLVVEHPEIARQRATAP